MTIPGALLNAPAVDSRPWVIVPGDTAYLDAEPEEALDCAGCDLELVCEALDGTPLFEIAEIDIDWTTIATGNFTAEISLEATTTLADMVTADDKQVTVGWYRISVVDSVADQRRTIGVGPIVVRYAPEIPVSP